MAWFACRQTIITWVLCKALSKVMLPNTFAITRATSGLFSWNNDWTKACLGRVESNAAYSASVDAMRKGLADSAVPRFASSPLVGKVQETAVVLARQVAKKHVCPLPCLEGQDSKMPRASVEVSFAYRVILVIVTLCTMRCRPSSTGPIIDAMSFSLS